MCRIPLLPLLIEARKTSLCHSLYREQLQWFIAERKKVLGNGFLKEEQMEHRCIWTAPGPGDVSVDSNCTPCYPSFQVNQKEMHPLGFSASLDHLHAVNENRDYLMLSLFSFPTTKLFSYWLLSAANIQYGIQYSWPEWYCSGTQHLCTREAVVRSLKFASPPFAWE